MANSDIIIKKVRYARWMIKELENNLEFLPDEVVEYRTGISIVNNFFTTTPGLLAVTNLRLIFLRHYMTRRDDLMYLPLSAITKVSLETAGINSRFSELLHITYGDTKIVFGAMRAFTSAKETLEHSVQTQMFHHTAEEPTREVYALLQQHLGSSICR